MVASNDNWMQREYEHQMSVRPSNISFEDWMIVKGYKKQGKPKISIMEYKELSDKERIFANCIIEIIADVKASMITKKEIKDWKYYYNKYSQNILPKVND